MKSIFGKSMLLIQQRIKAGDFQSLYSPAKEELNMEKDLIYWIWIVRPAYGVNLVCVANGRVPTGNYR